MCPPRCLPTENTWLDTQIVPLADTVRATQSSPERSRSKAVVSSGSCGGCPAGRVNRCASRREGFTLEAREQLTVGGSG